MPLNTEVDYNNVVIKGTVELGVKGERGLQGFKGDQGIQGPPVPVAQELGDDPEVAVSQKLLTDSIADMEQSNEAAVMEATNQAGLAEAARDAAFVNADVYPDVAAGLAAVVDGEQFQVLSDEGLEYRRYRKDSATVATEVGEGFPTPKQVEGAVAAAQSAAYRAETARDAAFVNADVYPDVATGRAAVANGEQFQVVEGDYLIRYRKDSPTVATEVARINAKPETNLEINERIYDLQVRTGFVSGELSGPYLATNLLPRSGVEWSVVNNELVLSGNGLHDRYGSLFWLGHQRASTRNTEIVVRMTLDADYVGNGGPGPQVFFGDAVAELKGVLFANNGQVFVHTAQGLATGEGTSPITPDVAFTAGDVVEMRVVLRDSGSGFVVARNLTKGTSLMLQIPDTSGIPGGRVWVAAHKVAARTIHSFAVNELDIVPEDFDTESVLTRITVVEQKVDLIENSSQERFVPVRPPSGFSVYTPLGVKFYRGLSSKQFITDIIPDSFRGATSRTVYLDRVAGSDSNDGSEASPLKTLSKAVDVVNAGGIPATIIAAAGEYSLNEVGVLATMAVRFNLICEDAQPAEFALSTTESEWVKDLTHTDLWRVTVTDPAPIGAYDKGRPDEYGTPSGLIKRSSLAMANSNAGSFFVDGNTIYVRLYDDREPDGSVRVTRDVPGFNTGNNLFYMENVIFRGGNVSATTVATAAGISAATRCGFTHGARNAFLVVHATGAAILMHRCEAAWAQTSDGFTYTTPGIGSTVLEIECIGHHNGIGNGSVNNGSTIHKAIRCIRVNGEYRYNNNKNLADTNQNTMSWNLGVITGDAMDSGSPGRSVNFAVGDGAKMWLDSCISDGGSLTDFEVGTGCELLVRNTDTASFKTITGDGTLARY